MPLTRIQSAALEPNALTSASIADGNVTSIKMSTTGVTSGTYGNSTSVSRITVDSAGRITSASNVSLNISSSGSDIFNAINLGAL